MLFSFEYWQETTWFLMQFGSEWTQSFVNFSQTTNYKWHALQACAIMLSLKNLLMLISAKLHLKSCYYLDIYEQFFPRKSIFHSVYEKDEVLMAVGITAVSCGLFSTLVILFYVFFFSSYERCSDKVMSLNNKNTIDASQFTCGVFIWLRLIKLVV